MSDAKDKVTLLCCPPEQTGSTCEPFDDPNSHGFKGWVEDEDGLGGGTVCSRCGISALDHSLRYGP